MLKVLEDYFEGKKWQFTQVKNKNIFLFGISGNNGNLQCIADIREEEHQFLFFSVCGLNTPAEKRSQMLELINRINFDLFLGNFEMDFEDGEVRYKTSIFFDFISPNKDMLDQLIMVNITTMDKYLPALTGVMFGELNALEALELVAKKKDQEV